MSSDYSDLKIELIGTGEQSGTWGDTTNTNLGTALEEAIVGRATANFTTDADLTLTLTNTNATQVARNYILNVTSSVSLSTTRNLVVPTIDKPYIIENNTTGSQSIVVKTAAGSGVTVPNGTKVMVYANSTNVVAAQNHIPSLTLGSALPAGSGGTGITAAGASGNILTSDGTTWTSTAPAVTLAGNNAFTGANTFYNTTGQTFGTGTSTQDGVIIAGRAGGSSSYRVTLTPTTLTASRTLTLPNVTDTVATIGTAQTFTAAQTFRAASAIRSEAAATQDAVVIAGRAGGTNSYAITLTPETLTASRTFTLPEPGENVTIGYQNIPQNSKSAAYTLVATDAGKHIFHPSADTTARTWTIPANGTVPFPIGTAITFINQNGAGVITISITTDTMRLAGAGTTGNRTLAANGIATAVKVTATEWIISGAGLS